MPEILRYFINGANVKARMANDAAKIVDLSISTNYDHPLF